MRRELRCGAIAGAAGGAVLAAVLLFAGEGPLSRAIDREAGGGFGGVGAAGGQALVSRPTQRVGGVVAALLVGLALGLVLAFVAELFRRQKVPAGPDPWSASVRLAALAFVAVNLVPLLKYPPSPPGVGNPDTIGSRTGAYIALVAWSLVVGWAAWRAWRWLERRRTPLPVAAPAVVLAALALVALAYAVLPPAASADGVPAGELWSFRLATLGGWAAYWAVAGTVLGWLRLPAGHLRRARLGGERTAA